MLLFGLLTEPLRLFYCDQYPFPLPEGHKFPLAKYRLLREELTGDPRFTLQSATLATERDALRVHSKEYVLKFLDGSVETSVIRRIGFPWSPELVKRTMASLGSTLCAARTALKHGFGGTLAGGTHHAYRNEGAGFCVVNDLAVAVETVRAESGVAKFAIVDLDVHQGDGTASIFAGDNSVFTLSLHGDRNFPFRKQTSTLDIPLPDGIGDEEYLAALAPGIEAVFRFRPEVLFFQAGVDGLHTDKLGRLALTSSGLAKRDRKVGELALSLGVPLVVTIGGGYSERIGDTVAAHAQTFRTMAELYSQVDRQSA